MRGGTFPSSLELTIIPLSQAPSLLLESNRNLLPGSKSTANPMGMAGPRTGGWCLGWGQLVVVAWGSGM